jgi:hypothetical protein
MCAYGEVVHATLALDIIEPPVWNVSPFNGMSAHSILWLHTVINSELGILCCVCLVGVLFIRGYLLTEYLFEKYAVNITCSVLFDSEWHSLGGKCRCQ